MFHARHIRELADAWVEATFGQGGTWNPSDKELLVRLPREPRTQQIVKDVIAIEPLKCLSVSKWSVTTIWQFAIIECTFRENGDHIVTCEIGFCVLEKSSESTTIGKPTLDTLGFVSNSEVIELQSIDVKFPTVRRRDEEDPTLSDPIEHCLRPADAVHIEPVAGRCGGRPVELRKM